MLSGWFQRRGQRCQLGFQVVVDHVPVRTRIRPFFYQGDRLLEGLPGQDRPMVCQMNAGQCRQGSGRAARIRLTAKKAQSPFQMDACLGFLGIPPVKGDTKVEMRGGK